MTRRSILSLPALALAPALEVGPASADERLRACVLRWLRAEGSVADTLRAWHSAREVICAATLEGASGPHLARLVEQREMARSEWERAGRELADAEAQMLSAARIVKDG
jgi:hypothetical protein